MRIKRGQFHNCDNCGQQVWVYPRDSFRKNHFCTKKCSLSYQTNNSIKETKKCETCKKEYKCYPSQEKHRGLSKFCSKKCKGQSMKGKDNKDWKGGVALKKRLWIYFSKYIRQRDGGVCISCGKKDDWKKMDAGHYIPKTAGLAIYFDERNVNCQCTYCNRWMHGNLSRYAIALRMKHGESILEDLDRQRQQIRKFTVADYQRMTDEYKKKIVENGFLFS